MKKCLVLVVAGVAAFALWAEDAYIQSDGTQYIRTDYYANANTKIVCDFAYTSTTVQQRIFGADADDDSVKFSMSSYINGNGQYAWASQKGKGNWMGTGLTADLARRTLVMDNPNSAVTLNPGGYNAKMSTTRTGISIWPLAIFTDNRSANYATQINPASAKLYSFAIYDNGVLVRYYKPYKSADGKVVGLKELVTDAVVTSPKGNSFTCGGDISDNPTWDLSDVRKTADGLEYRVSATPGDGGTVLLKKNGSVVEGTECWMKGADIVELTAMPATGKRFLQWQGETGAFAPGCYAGNAAVRVLPKGSAILTVAWATPKTRTWVAKEKDGNGRYYWNYAQNWIDESGNGGKPLIGDTVIYGDRKVPGGSYQLSESNANNPLYEVLYKDVETVSMNQGSFALLAGGRGLQYGRNANSGSNWSGLCMVGDGPVPVNIINNVSYVMQKACTVGTLNGYRTTPIAVKQGKGTVINCNQSGNYTYSVPDTQIQEGGWDITLTSTLQGCIIGFDGAAPKKLTFCYSSYETDLAINNGGIYEINGAANHAIGANNKNHQIIFTGVPKFNPMVFSGRFVEGAGLKWSPSEGDCVFVCSNAVSDTKGKLIVEKGTVKLVKGASFTALSELAVSAGATLEIEPGSGANFKAALLSLGGTKAKIKVGAGTTLTFEAATMTGSAMSPRTYTAEQAPWIEGEGSVVVLTGPGNVATWCGAGEGPLATVPENWQMGSTPDLSAGDLLATFAVGGSEAAIASSVAFDGIVLNNGFGGESFAFTAQSNNAGATLNGNGLTVTKSDKATIWTMGWPLTLGAAQTWDVGANNTLKIDATLSGSQALLVTGNGVVNFNAKSVHTGPLELKGGTVKVSADNGLGTKDRTVNYHHMLTKYVFSGNISLDAPMYSSDLCESTESFMTVEPNSHVTFNGNFGYRAQGGITFGEGSTTVFNGGFKCDTDGMKGMLYPYGSGTIIISNKNISTMRAWQGSALHPVTLELCCPWNVFNDSSYWAKFRSGRLVTRVDKAIWNGGQFLSFEDAEFDLDGHDQQIGLLATTAKTRITSARPATLSLTSATVGDTQDGNYGGDSRVDSAVYSGLVSFSKLGSHPHTFGATSTSSGAVEVVEGTIKMNATGKWPNATGVRVAGGKLELQNAEAFGSNAIWRVTTTNTGAVVALNYTGTNKCERLYVDGHRLVGGVYGAADSGAAREVSWISGKGVLSVAEHGFCVYLQ